MSASSPDSGPPPQHPELDPQVLAGLRAELEADRVALGEQIRRLDEEFAEESSTRPTSDDEVDTGSATSERERTMSLARHARSSLVQIDAAIERMDAGTYGLCTSCGQAIPAARLEARPQSVLCVPCAQVEARGR
jgi:DnaK suppressor protein